MQKTTEDEENIFLSGFPIKNFGNDERGVIPEWFYEESKLFKGKSLWMPDKKFQA